MGFRDWLKGKPNNLDTKAKTGVAVIDPEAKNNELAKLIYQALTGGPVKHYAENDDTFINKGYRWNPHVYTVVSYICRSKSQVPFYSYEVTNRKNHEEYLKYKADNRFNEARLFLRKSMRLVESGGIADVLKKPNSSQGWSQYMYSKTGFKEITGNAYTYGQNAEGYNEDAFSFLYVAPSQIIEPVMGSWMQPVKGFKLKYDPNDNNIIEAFKILHQKDWNPLADQRGPSPLGQSPLQALLRSMQRSNENYNAGLALLTNGGPAGVLSNDSGRIMTPKEVDAQEEAFSKKFGGGINVNKIMHAATQLSWQSIGLSPVDLDLLASNKADLGDFCRAYGVDSIIFDQEQSSYNNKQTAKKAVWEDKFIPDLNLERDDLNIWLAPGWSEQDSREYYIDYDVSNVKALQIDRKELSARLTTEFDRGTWSQNEMRIMLGDEPDLTDASMDKRYIKSDYKIMGEVSDPTLNLLLSINPNIASKLMDSLTPEQIAKILKV